MKGHYDEALLFSNSLRTSTGRDDLNKRIFIKLLIDHCQKKGIKHITKLRCIDIDDLFNISIKPLIINIDITA